MHMLSCHQSAVNSRVPEVGENYSPQTTGDHLLHVNSSNYSPFTLLSDGPVVAVRTKPKITRL